MAELAALINPAAMGGGSRSSMNPLVKKRMEREAAERASLVSNKKGDAGELNNNMMLEKPTTAAPKKAASSKKATDFFDSSDDEDSDDQQVVVPPTKSVQKQPVITP